VHDIAIARASLDGAKILGITGEDRLKRAAFEWEDAYVRQHDLVADYALRLLGLKLRVYWTATCDPASPDVVVLALTASLRTDLLDVEPTVHCHSTLPAQAVERLDESLAAHQVALASEPTEVSASDTLALLFSCTGDVVYAEIPHPTDVPRSSITGAGDSGKAVTITHDLFTERLEKGVIVRARILGLILPRDATTADRIGQRYQTFTTMPPPLET
jgi:hypothetical protein